MIDKMILDEVLPVPELEALKEQKIQELREEGFVITNYNSGGIFHMLLMIALQIRIELIMLLRSVLNRMFVSHSDGVWLELKAADYSKVRKAATKTRGILHVSKAEHAGDSALTVTIPKGTVFKTPKDINGEELRYFSTEKVILSKDMKTAEVPIEAEKEGSRYNVPEGYFAFFFPKTESHSI